MATPPTTIRRLTRKAGYKPPSRFLRTHLRLLRGGRGSPDGLVEASYPVRNSSWLPGPSSCYVPELHGLPDTQFITYKEPNHPVYGSFNHTRKITRASQERFGAVLSFNPDAVLQFRSYSFSDSAVRRHFLQRFRDVGIAAHQLQPLPYAPSYGEATADFGRIHLFISTAIP